MHSLESAYPRGEQDTPSVTRRRHGSNGSPTLLLHYLTGCDFLPSFLFEPVNGGRQHNILNQPKVAGVFAQRNVGLEVKLSLSLVVPLRACQKRSSTQHSYPTSKM